MNIILLWSLLGQSCVIFKAIIHLLQDGEGHMTITEIYRKLQVIVSLDKNQSEHCLTLDRGHDKGIWLD